MPVDKTTAHHEPENIDEFKAEIQSEIEALTHTVKKLAQHVKHSSQQQGHDMMDKAVDCTKDNPMKSLGIACGLGIVIGMILKR